MNLIADVFPKLRTQKNLVRSMRKKSSFKGSFKFWMLKKKMTLIAEVFPKLPTPKKLVRSMSKKSHFKESFGKEHGKCAQNLSKFAWQHFYHIYWSLWTHLSCKKSLLVTCKISRLFPNTLSAHCKYSLFNRGNFTQPI